MPNDSVPPSARTRVTRRANRGHYDQETVHAVLDAAIYCHVGYVIDGQPFVTPTAHWREGNRLYWHGSSASRMLTQISGGIPVCVTVSLVDGLVLARAGFNHSLNYRSVIALGEANLVSDPDEKTERMRLFMERVSPGRWEKLRPITPAELKATTVLGMALDEASAKIRAAGVGAEPEEDLATPVWAGVIPIVTSLGKPEPDARLLPGLVPPSIAFP